MKRSRAAQQALEQYRLGLTPSPSSREHALGELAQRVARGEPPALPAPAPPALPVPAALSPALLIAVFGPCALVLTAAWGWHAYGARSRPAADRPATAISARTPPPAAPAPDLHAREPGTSGARPHERAPDRRAPAAEAAPAAAARRTALPIARRAAPSGAARPRDAARPRAADEPPAALEPAPVEVEPSTGSASVEGQQRAEVEPGATAPERMPPTQPDSAQRDGLEQELRLMRSAYDALRAGKPERALAQLAEHAWRFPRGELRESRQVARIMALCQAGKTTAARQEAQTFLRLSPSSPYAARVRSLCVEPRARVPR